MKSLCSLGKARVEKRGNGVGKGSRWGGCGVRARLDPFYFAQEIFLNSIPRSIHSPRDQLTR